MAPCRPLSCLLLLGLLGWSGCLHLPPLSERPVSAALEDTADTRLGRAVQPQLHAHPGASGVVTLNDGRDSFSARALLADAAERSLDVQYYIWHDDVAGSLLFAALRRAADRGVRVRLLLDDNNCRPALDTVLAALDAHPNIEVRLFNPFMHRRWHALGYLTDFTRLNRRMHNKSFTADNQVSIVGGRNIGDEYFGASQDVDFVDLDALAIGPVVDDVSRDFDRYWASDSAYPVARLLHPPTPAAVAAVENRLEQVARGATAEAYLATVARQPFVKELLEQKLDFEFTTVRVVSDDPAKALGHGRPDRNLLPRVTAILGNPKSELLLVSPYFVPTSSGTAALGALAASGVRVSVLTNSLEATDVTAVHAGYAKYRRSLLRSGVKLYEMRRQTPVRQRHDRGLTGSSASSLHAKTAAIDQSHVFIGSFNLDPRSATHNTELGFVIESPAKARAISEMFSTRLDDHAYQVRLDEHGELVWVEHVDDTEVELHREPDAGVWRRAEVVVLSWLPIEWLL